MSVSIISFLLITFGIYNSYKAFVKDKSLIKEVYLYNKIDYLYALLILLSIVLVSACLVSINLPEFLKWSWLSIFNHESMNLATKPFFSENIAILISFWLILSFCIPFLAKNEEESFRSLKLTKKERVISSIEFGIVHMVVGVPVIAAIILCFVGYLFSEIYVREFKKHIKEHDAEFSDKKATLKTTSIHAKYNFIICTILFIVGILISI